VAKVWSGAGARESAILGHVHARRQIGSVTLDVIRITPRV
jgi:hypothetical protein